MTRGTQHDMLHRGKWNQNGRAMAEVILAVFFTSVLSFVVYQLAVSRAEPGFDELKEQNLFLRQELDKVAGRLEESQARLAVLQQETNVVRNANRLLREQETERQAEINRLQGEVDFYGRLAGTGGEQTGLAVYQVELTRTESPMVYRFILTLTQNIQRASIVTGKASLDVEGTLDDRPVTLYWSQLSEGTDTDMSFRFKYFQQMEGYLTLPEGVSPMRLVVSLEAKGERKPVTRAFEWQDLLIERD